MFSAASPPVVLSLPDVFEERISEAFHFLKIFFTWGAPSLFQVGGAPRSARARAPCPPRLFLCPPGGPFFHDRRFLHSQQWRSGAVRARPGSSQSAIGSSTSSAARFSS